MKVDALETAVQAWEVLHQNHALQWGNRLQEGGNMEPTLEHSTVLDRLGEALRVVYVEVQTPDGRSQLLEAAAQEHAASGRRGANRIAHVLERVVRCHGTAVATVCRNATENYQRRAAELRAQLEYDSKESPQPQNGQQQEGSANHAGGESSRLAALNEKTVEQQSRQLRTVFRVLRNLCALPALQAALAPVAAHVARTLVAVLEQYTAETDVFELRDALYEREENVGEHRIGMEVGQGEDAGAGKTGYGSELESDPDEDLPDGLSDSATRILLRSGLQFFCNLTAGADENQKLVWDLLCLRDMERSTNGSLYMMLMREDDQLAALVCSLVYNCICTSQSRTEDFAAGRCQVALGDMLRRNGREVSCSSGTLSICLLLSLFALHYHHPVLLPPECSGDRLGCRVPCSALGILQSIAALVRGSKLRCF